MKKVIYSTFLLLFCVCACHSVRHPSDRWISLGIMSFNIRYDNKDDGDNQWHHRTDSIRQMIRKEDPDLIGMQEVLHNQLQDLLALLPEYGSVGVGREDGKEAGEYGPIFYKKARFSVLKSGWFWLKPDSLTPGKGWDAGCERIVTWAIMQPKDSLSKPFLFLNTHLDNAGTVARRNSVPMILNAIQRLAGHGAQLPTILTGDFNSIPSDSVILALTDTTNLKHLTNTATKADHITGHPWTFHDFGHLPLSERPLIDYIFIKGAGIKVSDLSYLNEPDTTLTGAPRVYLSDHAPVLVHLTMP